MRFRFVALAIFRSCTRRAEVPKSKDTPTVRLSIPAEYLLKNKFGFAIGVQRLLGRVFINGPVTWRSVHRSSRREDELANAGSPQRLKHSDAGSYVVLKEYS